MRYSRYKSIIFVFCLLVIPISPLYSQYVIKGTIVGHNDKPMIRSDIFLVSNRTKFPRDINRSYRVDSNGSFEISINGPGLHRFRMIGINHKEYELPVYMDAPDTVHLQIRLANKTLKKELEKIRIYTDYDIETEKLRNKEEVVKNEEGIFTADFIAIDDEFEFEIPGLFEVGYGLRADFFIPHSNDYVSVIRTEKDSVITIQFDPGQVPDLSDSSGYEVISAPENTVKFFQIHDDWEKRWADHHEYVMEGRSRGIYDSDYANNYGWKKDFKELDKKIKMESDPFLRKGWIILRIHVAALDAWAKREMKLSRELAQMALEEIEPASPLWSYHANTMSQAIGYASRTKKTFSEVEKEHIYLKTHGKPFMAYINQALATHPDSSIGEYLLRSAAGYARKFQEHELFEHYYNQYLERYKDNDRYIRIMESRFSPSRRIKQDANIPDFTFTSFDDSNHTISNSELLGKNYIITFWATWCGPCKPSLEVLSRMHEEFRGPDFEIIGISLNYNREIVTNFRKDKLPLPWFNTHLDKWKPDEGILSDFEVVTIPRSILVDENGVIVEINNYENMVEILRGKGL